MNLQERVRGAFDLIFRPNQLGKVNGYFQMLDGYSPSFTTYDGGVYEMELTRSCIHAFAENCGKLQPNVEGAGTERLANLLDGKVNPFMTAFQFVYKAATIYDAQNTCFIIPIVDELDRTVGFYPANPLYIEFVSVDGSDEPYVRYTFGDGSKKAMELSRCGVVSKHLYGNDIMGEDNSALNSTMQLIHAQNKGIEEGAKQAAAFRFMARVGNFTTGDDLKRERERFVANNMGDGSGGLALFPSHYTDIQQIKSNPQMVDAEQMRIIQNRVYNYFGINDAVLQNKAIGDEWSAYYEGRIEPFAIQLSQAMTCMSFSEDERRLGCRITWDANNLQFMTARDKLDVSSANFDRGVFSQNDCRRIWGLPPVEGGDTLYIRKEYVEYSKMMEEAEDGDE